MPLRRLREEGVEVRGLFDNPNIHPYKEWAARRKTLEEHCGREGVELLPTPEYGLARWLREVVFHETERCRICYRMRLAATASAARAGGFDVFSTTLLYSKYQNHDLIRETGEEVGREAGVSFLYRDWRVDWQEGVEESRRLEMYRQAYCGCIFSEEERYRPRSRNPAGRVATELEGKR
jgi:predicted adenine nucleotide alpha hydrolase (AANH) superfamily ATPase